MCVSQTYYYPLSSSTAQPEVGSTQHTYGAILAFLWMPRS